MARVKHFLSGGYWWDSGVKQWVQAGDAVLAVLPNDRIVQRHLGWVSPVVVVPGTVMPKPLKKNPAVQWQQSVASGHWTVANGTQPQPQSLWRFGRSLSAQSGDNITVQNWVVAKDLQGRTTLGRVHELLTAELKATFVTVEQFICSKQLHRDFSWPVLRRPNGSEIIDGAQSFLILPSTHIQFVISVQHDCRMGHCQPVVAGKEQQEHEETNRDKTLIKHTDDDHFVINMGALHNFTKLCRVLPRELTQLRLLFPERNEFHKKVTQQARAGRDARRKKTAAKRRQNADAKKLEADEADRAARAAEQAATEGQDLEDDVDDSDAGNGDIEDVDGPESEDEPNAVDEHEPARKRKRR
jgi:hypothetical protein